MFVWVAPDGRVVGEVRQGTVGLSGGRAAAIYEARAMQMVPEQCPRFMCAKNKVEEQLRRLGISARAVQA